RRRSDAPRDPIPWSRQREHTIVTRSLQKRASKFLEGQKSEPLQPPHLHPSCAPCEQRAAPPAELPPEQTQEAPAHPPPTAQSVPSHRSHAQAPPSPPPVPSTAPSRRSTSNRARSHRPRRARRRLPRTRLSQVRRKSRRQRTPATPRATPHRH